MRKLRVMIVGISGAVVGGVTTVTKAVQECAAFRDFEICHCNLTKGRREELSGTFSIYNMFWAIVHFSRMLRSVIVFRPHVVYMPLTGTWSGFWRDSVIAWLGKRGGAKVLGHVHGGWFDRILAAKGIKGKLVRRCLDLFDGLLMLGSKWERLIKSYGYRRKIFVVPPTIRRELFEKGVAFKRDYRVNDPLGLYVGHVGKHKGILDLLEALHRLKKSGRPAKMRIVGPPQFEGDWKAVMARYVELELQDIVEFTGRVDDETLYENFRRADFFILPSYFEGLPVVYLEAGAFGLPVIGTPVGSTPDLLVHDVNALLVEPGNVRQIAETIDSLRSNAADRERLGTELRKRVLEYHPDIICERILSAIHVVTGESL